MFGLCRPEASSRRKVSQSIPQQNCQTLMPWLRRNVSATQSHYRHSRLLPIKQDFLDTDFLQYGVVHQLPIEHKNNQKLHAEKCYNTVDVWNAQQARSSLRSIGLLNLMMGPFMIEQIFGPRRQLLVSLVQVSAVVTETSRASRAIAYSPDSRTPDIAMCTSPCVSFARFTSVCTSIMKHVETYLSVSPPSCPP